MAPWDDRRFMCTLCVAIVVWSVVCMALGVWFNS